MDQELYFHLDINLKLHFIANSMKSAQRTNKKNTARSGLILKPIFAKRICSFPQN